MINYLAVRGIASGPLFQFQDGSPLQRRQLVLAIRNALANQNFDVSQYCGHSFRIGAATTAARNGIEDCIIKILGRWESTAYQLYIRTPRATYIGIIHIKINEVTTQVLFSSRKNTVLSPVGYILIHT